MSVAVRQLDELEQAKLDALKELAYGASHEINNPLANISARAQTLLRDEPDPERRRALEAIQQQALRAHEMISDLMLFARPPRLARAAGRRRRSCLQQVRAELAAECRRRDVELMSPPTRPCRASWPTRHNWPSPSRRLCRQLARGDRTRRPDRRRGARGDDRRLAHRNRRSPTMAQASPTRFGRTCSTPFTPVARQAAAWGLAFQSAGES